jgi:hypothetical protein
MNQRQTILLLCLLVVICAVVLAASLHDVHFEPARSFGASTGSSPMISVPSLEVAAATPVWKLLLLWSVLLVNIVLFLWLLPPEARKRIIRQVLSFALGALALMLALHYRMIQLPGLPPNPVEAAGGGAAPSGSGSTTLSFRPPQVTPWMAYLIALVVLWIVFLAVWYFYRRWKRLRGYQGGSLGALADIARSSLRDIGKGRQWTDIVIETYARMNDTVGTRRGLSRAAACTPREFAERLVSAGLPPDSVERLTRLFESVRYGGHASTDRDRREAVDCLEAIVRACGAQA